MINELRVSFLSSQAIWWHLEVCIDWKQEFIPCIFIKQYIRQEHWTTPFSFSNHLATTYYFTYIFLMHADVHRLFLTDRQWGRKKKKRKLFPRLATVAAFSLCLPRAARKPRILWEHSNKPPELAMSISAWFGRQKTKTFHPDWLTFMLLAPAHREDEKPMVLKLVWGIRMLKTVKVSLISIRNGDIEGGPKGLSLGSRVRSWVYIKKWILEKKRCHLVTWKKVALNQKTFLAFGVAYALWSICSLVFLMFISVADSAHVPLL